MSAQLIEKEKLVEKHQEPEELPDSATTNLPISNDGDNVQSQLQSNSESKVLQQTSEEQDQQLCSTQTNPSECLVSSPRPSNTSQQSPPLPCQSFEDKEQPEISKNSQLWNQETSTSQDLSTAQSYEQVLFQPATIEQTEQFETQDVLLLPGQQEGVQQVVLSDTKAGFSPESQAGLQHELEQNIQPIHDVKLQDSVSDVDDVEMGNSHRSLSEIQDTLHQTFMQQNKQDCETEFQQEETNSQLVTSEAKPVTPESEHVPSLDSDSNQQQIPVAEFEQTQVSHYDHEYEQTINPETEQPQYVESESTHVVSSTPESRQEIKQDRCTAEWQQISDSQQILPEFILQKSIQQQTLQDSIHLQQFVPKEQLQEEEKKYETSTKKETIILESEQQQKNFVPDEQVQLALVSEEQSPSKVLPQLATETEQVPQFVGAESEAQEVQIQSISEEEQMQFETISEEPQMEFVQIPNEQHVQFLQLQEEQQVEFISEEQQVEFISEEQQVEFISEEQQVEFISEEQQVQFASHDQQNEFESGDQTTEFSSEKHMQFELQEQHELSNMYQKNSNQLSQKSNCTVYQKRYHLI
ncbi:Hypothetical predicted protein [Octopus vulgaris]|uniref:Uncharacterized protein n=1 Tax=Octopus vulgaris TaxID=6645 RepID=A0AA36ANF0_OCTVU|nr:Hypothetical predicted protein [Octopus vulgaris]